MKKANIVSDLQKLKALLPRGSNKDIAASTGYDEVYVSNILSGKQELNTTNIIVVEAAQKIAEEAQTLLKSKMKSLNKFLSENKA